MRVVLATVGTRGDAVPFAALAARLLREGHEPVLVTHESFRDTAPAGAVVHIVPGDAHQLLAGPGGRALRRLDPVGLNRARGEFAAFVSAVAAPVSAALEGADLLIASTFAIGAVDVARQRGVPVVRAHQWPENEALHGPMPLLPYAWALPAPARRAMRAGMRRAEPYLGGFDGGWRRGRLRLHPHHPAGLTGTTHGSLLAVSPRLLAGLPVDAAVTGWWQEPEGPREPREPNIPGVDPLAAGTWVAMGFGSMPQAHPERLWELASTAARRVGVRLALQLPGTEGREDGTARGLGAVPHEVLFARVALAVHHGGAGTTGAAARAGVPTVVVPHVADQFFWGHRAQRLGIAPRPLPRPLLTADRLARALDQGLREAPRRRAAALGEQVRAEDGTGAAVHHLERVLAHPGDPGALRSGAGTP